MEQIADFNVKAKDLNYLRYNESLVGKYSFLLISFKLSLWSQSASWFHFSSYLFKALLLID